MFEHGLTLVDNVFFTGPQQIVSLLAFLEQQNKPLVLVMQILNQNFHLVHFGNPIISFILFNDLLLPVKFTLHLTDDFLKREYK